MKTLVYFVAIILSTTLVSAKTTVPQYEVYELSFSGPVFQPADTPTRDIELATVWQHESGTRFKIWGFYDADGQGGMSGNVFKVRFCPTLPGTWTLLNTTSNNDQLDNQHEGFTLECTASGHPGFWLVDEESAGGRWYKRSDGSHPYIIGNTMYTFLSEYDHQGPNGGDIASDIRNNADYFNKIRFGLTGGRYPHPVEKPFLNDNGQPTDDGNFSHRPNPRWFHQRVDLAVQQAYQKDMIADLILNGPDTNESRSILVAGQNGGDTIPFLRYIAARYGSYPNVWMCLSNEWNIKTPHFESYEIVAFGRLLQRYLPCPTPLSVHANQCDWNADLNADPPWNDHIILQNKLKTLPLAADFLFRNYWIGEQKPVIDDELAYQGQGDGWSETDVIEAMLGAFLGGGYGTTGYKHPETKQGHYFAGDFSADEHTAAVNLKWFRDVIDADISFWKMEPVFVSSTGGTHSSRFSRIAGTFRAMQWPGHEYVLGTNRQKENIRVNLPDGTWNIARYNLINQTTKVLSTDATDAFVFDAPDSRAVLFHVRRME